MRQKKAELERRRIAAAIAEQRAKEDMAALKIQSMARRWQARKMVRDKLELARRSCGVSSRSARKRQRWSAQR